MRIALFTETFLPKMDGIVTTLCQTIRQLGELGNQVLIFAPEGGITEFEHFRVVGMKSHAFPIYPELRLALPRASMRRVLAEFEPNILHVADPALLGIAGLYYGGGRDGGALRVPLVVSYHTDLPKYLHYYRLGWLEPHVWKMLRARHRRATANLCTSLPMVRQLEEHGIEEVGLWPGGVDADLFHPSRKSAEMRCRLTEGHPDRPLLLYVGRLSAEKNLESLRPVLRALPDARLALVGDGPHRKTLEEHFAGLLVHFAGFLYREELAAAYASSDIFLMPSRTETLGLVVLEAMCSKLPVVAANAGGIPEMIEDGVSGYLIDTDALAIERIGELLHSKQKREAIGERARAEASGRSWREATLQLLEHYDNAIEKQALRAASGPAPARAGLRARTGRAVRRATIFTARKLLP
ncbi:MAG TPA: glycosyltransferase family 1 protein [Acidobacteriaceae bacterium]|nr:glycosyltransferase family 1 protein [Acidobacteriaceae bacterium]